MYTRNRHCLLSFQRIVRAVKKAVRTRWLSLHNSVDSVFVEYLGLVKALEKIGG